MRVGTRPRACLAAAALLTLAPGLGAGAFPGGDPVRFHPATTPFEESEGPTPAAVNDIGDALVVVSPAAAETGIAVRERRGFGAPWGPLIDLGPTNDEAVTAVAMSRLGAAVVLTTRGRELIAYRRDTRTSEWRTLGAIAAARPDAIQIVRAHIGDAADVKVLHALPTGRECATRTCRWTVRVFEQAGSDAPLVRTARLVTPPIANPAETATTNPAETMAIGPRGDAIVAWESPLLRRPVRVARRVAGRPTFEAPVAVSDPDGIAPSVAIAANGDAIVSWFSPDDPREPFRGRVSARIRSAGAPAWGPRTDLTPLHAGSPRFRPVLDSRGRGAQAAIDALGNAIVVWTTTRLGVTEAASNEDEVRAAVRRAGSTGWELSPLLADNRFGRFLAVTQVLIRRRTAYVATRSTSDTLGPPVHYLAVGEIAARRWRRNATPERFPSSPIAAAPGGTLLITSGDLSVVSLGRGRRDPRVIAIDGLTTIVAGDRATVRFQVSHPATLWIERTAALCGADGGRCASREVAAGAGSLVFEGLPAGTYRIKLGACHPVLGCALTRRVAFRVR